MRVPNFRSLADFGWKEFKELSLRLLLPKGFSENISIRKLPHEPFQLDAGSGLYDPARNNDLQQGTFSGFIFGPAIIWPAVGGITDTEGHLVRESFLSDHFLRQSAQHRLLRKFSVVKSNAPYVTCIGHIHRNYFHRHIDSIPRLYGLHHPRLLELPAIELIIDPRFSADEIDVIRKLIPPNVSIRRVPYSCRVKAKKYIHLPFLSGKRHDRFDFIQNCGGYLPQDYLNYYRRTMTEHWGLDKVDRGKRIYISRQDARIRRIRNEAEVMAHLEKLGFESYTLSDMPLKEQARLFAGASVIITLHGAALTNLLYARPDATLVEIFPRRGLPIFSTLAEALGMQYITIMLQGSNKNVDMELPISKLNWALQRAGVIAE